MPGIIASGNLTIKGGQVSSANAKVKVGGTITLGWMKATDFIWVQTIYKINGNSYINYTDAITLSKSFVKFTSVGYEFYNDATTTASNIQGKKLYANKWNITNDDDGRSKEKAFEISNVEELKLLSMITNDGYSSGRYFKLKNNITFTNTSTENNFTPIGLNPSPYSEKCFMGHFDGQGYFISGIRINNDEQNNGLFRYIQNGSVKNLTLKNSLITGNAYAGGIAGQSISSTITNCVVASDVNIYAKKVTDPSYAGGIVGDNGSTIIGCSSAASVKADYAGGIAGYNNTTIKNCFAYEPTIAGDNSDNCGAIVGREEGSLSNNYYYTTTTLKGVGYYQTDNTTKIDVDGARKALSITTSDTYISFVPTGTATTYNNMTTYADNNVIKYGDVFYSGAGESVSLTFSYTGALDADKTAGYEVNGDAISGDTFMMPATDATITKVDVKLWGEGNGDSEATAYVISTPADLDYLAQKVNAGNYYSGKYFKLGANIEYDKNTENNFTPVGNSDHSFYGTFDGDGKSISGIKINKPENGTYQGIFGFVDGTVKNLVVSSSSIVAYQNIGAIAGCLRGDNNGTIENCRVENNVTLSGHNYVGGIVGQNGGAIKSCASATTIRGTIANESDNAEILGGIVGKTNSSSMLTDNVFTGTITGNLKEYIGAIVGENDNGTLKNNLHTSTRFGGIGKSGSTTGVDEDNARKAVAIGAASGVTIKPTGNATTYKTSGITSYADNSVIGYDSKLYAGATEAAKLTIAYTVPNGYEFNKIDAGEGVTVTASNDTYTITMPASDVTVDVVYKAIEYTLQYTGADGATFATANPTTYTVESDAITLTNPTKDGYTFAGWTGTGLTEATTTVTIAKGSTGNREYTATWSLADYTITYDLAGGTLAEGVSNPTGYNIDSDDITLNNPTREGYTFAGWTGTGLTEATTTVTIAKGSHENKTFTATWEKNPDTRYVVDDGGVAVTTMAYLAELALDDTMQDYVEKGKLKATITPKNKYWTLACGVDLLLPEGVKVYKARMNSAGTKVELTEIDAATLGGVLKANNGVLIASTPGQTYDLVVSPNNSVTTLSNADAKSYGTDNELEPVLEDTHFTTEDYFILMENKFIMVDISKDTKVPAGKAVLKVAAGSAKTRTLDVIDGETTGISSAVNSADDEVWYNLQGQRISKPTRKGVYILNGKKVKK